MADVPGLIEGASQGKGLGDEFLRHVERTSVLIHVIDAYNDDVVVAYKTIQKELTEYQVNLSAKPQVVVLNKIDGLDEDIIKDLQARLAKVVPKGTQQFAMSAQSGQGVREMLFAVKKLVDIEHARVEAEIEARDDVPILTLPDTYHSWKVEKQDEIFIVTGHKIERFAHRTDFESRHGVERLRDIMNKMGIMHQLRRMKINPGQKIRIGQPSIGSLEY